MKREIARRWVEALRSGEYAQTKGKLQRVVPGDHGEPEGFCCLGVLCELAVADRVIPEARQESATGGAEYGRSLVDEILPIEVQEWAGLSSQDPVLMPHESTSRCASYRNDNLGWTFEELADAIEATFLTPKRGDKVLLPIGSWYKGRFIDRDREVEGEVVVRYDDGSLLVRTDHGQKPNGCQTEQTVHRTSDEVKLVEEAGV